MTQNTDRKFLVVYETRHPTDIIRARFERKALIVYDDPDNAELPFGWCPDTLGPDEDPVERVLCIMDVSEVVEPRIVVDDIEYRFTATGAPEQVEHG